MADVKWRRGLANHLLDQNTEESTGRPLAKLLFAEAVHAQAEQENANAAAVNAFRHRMAGCLFEFATRESKLMQANSRKFRRSRPFGFGSYPCGLSPDILCYGRRSWPELL